jgi:hypothetical protein
VSSLGELGKRILAGQVLREARELADVVEGSEADVSQEMVVGLVGIAESIRDGNLDTAMFVVENLLITLMDETLH